MNIADFCSSVKSAKGVDPITLSIIVSVVLFLLQNCILNKYILRNPSPLKKWRLRQICYKADRDNWRVLYTELLQKAKSVSESQLDALKEDLKNYGPSTLSM